MDEGVIESVAFVAALALMLACLCGNGYACLALGIEAGALLIAVAIERRKRSPETDMDRP